MDFETVYATLLAHQARHDMQAARAAGWYERTWDSRQQARRFGEVDPDSISTRIRDLLADGRPRSCQEIADTMGIHGRTASNCLGCLRAAGVVVNIGDGRRGRWVLAAQMVPS